MSRTNDSAVRGIIETDSSVSLKPFIQTAASLVDWLEAQDAADQSLLSDDTLELIERYLAAHFYQANRDRNYSSKSTGRSSGSFQGQTAMVLTSTDPGQTAILLDVTNKLSRRSKEAEEGNRKRVGFTWLGTPSDSVRPDTGTEAD